MIKDGGLSFKNQLQVEFEFYHQITVVKNAWKNPFTSVTECDEVLIAYGYCINKKDKHYKNKKDQ